MFQPILQPHVSLDDVGPLRHLLWYSFVHTSSSSLYIYTFKPNEQPSSNSNCREILIQVLQLSTSRLTLRVLLSLQEDLKMGIRLPSILLHTKQILKFQGASSKVKSDIPKGHIAVYVGEIKTKRFVVPISFLNHPSFLNLLKRAEEEFGFNHPMGGLTIPCREETFIDLTSRLHISWEMEKKDQPSTQFCQLRFSFSIALSLSRISMYRKYIKMTVYKGGNWSVKWLAFSKRKVCPIKVFIFFFGCNYMDEFWVGIQILDWLDQKEYIMEGKGKKERLMLPSGIQEGWELAPLSI